MYNDTSYKSDSNSEPLEVRETFVSTENMTAFLVVALMNKISHFLLPVQLHTSCKLFHSSNGFPFLKLLRDKKALSSPRIEPAASGRSSTFTVGNLALQLLTWKSFLSGFISNQKEKQMQNETE